MLARRAGAIVAGLSALLVLPAWSRSVPAGPPCPLSSEPGEPGSPEGVVALPVPARRLGLVRDFAPLADDFTRLVRRDNLMVLAAGGALGLAASRADTRAVEALSGSGVADGAFEGGAVAGSWYALGGSALALYSLGRLGDRPALGDLGRDLLRAHIVSQSVTQALKAASRRERPDGSAGSFPSGHASGAFAAATVLQRRYGLRAGLPAFAVAGYIGASRLQESRHYLSDVLFGAALGIVAGRGIGGGERELSIAPFASAQGAGVGVVIRR